ncbi:hypothetical protein D3C81_1372350 [compost metagenome]
MEQKSNVGLSVVAALIAAIVGGAVWALIVILTNYEIGIVAWGIGGLTAYGTAMFAKKITPIHQIVAVLASLIGILLGKYVAFSYIVHQGYSGMFDSGTFSLFSENITLMFGAMDIIFILLAVATAWQLPIKLAANKASNQVPVDQGKDTTVQ